MPKGIKCVKCGHTSVVRSNFKGLSDGRFYCNSAKRPACEAERQNELRYEESMRKPSRGLVK
jgi:hypothetical protein